MYDAGWRNIVNVDVSHLTRISKYPLTHVVFENGH
jgi:hypothetical protein